MKPTLELLLMNLTDHANAISNKLVNAIGAVSIGAGVAITSVGDSVKAAQPDTWISPDYVMAASIFGSVCFGLKHLIDFVLKLIDRHRAKTLTHSE